MEMKVHCVAKVRRAQDWQQKKGFTSDTSVQGYNFEKVQCRLNLVNCRRDGKFTSAPQAWGVHMPRCIVAGEWLYFSAKDGEVEGIMMKVKVQ